MASISVSLFTYDEHTPEASLSEVRWTAALPIPTVAEYLDPDFDMIRYIPAKTPVGRNGVGGTWGSTPLIVAHGLVTVFWREMGKAVDELVESATTLPTA